MTSPVRLLFVVVLLCQANPVFAQGDAPPPGQAEPVFEQAGKEPNPRFGDETPEAAIRSFYTALASCDTVTACWLLVSPAKMKKWVEVQARMSSSFRHLGSAAGERFGEEGKSLQLPPPAELALLKLATVKPTEKGDKAEWATNPKVPTNLVRKDGHWKLDLHSSFLKPEHIDQQNVVLGRIAMYVNQIAQGIEKGEFESVDAVREEFKRQRAKMNEDLAKPKD
jgi:hypothetical protein